MLCPEDNGRLNELGEFQVSIGRYLDYILQIHSVYDSLKFFPFYMIFFWQICIVLLLRKARSPGSRQGVLRGPMTFDPLVAWGFIH